VKIILLHGEDIEKSHQRLEKFLDTAKSRSWEVVSLDDEPHLKDALSASSLFGGERFFVLRDVKKLGKKETDWLAKKYKDLAGNLIIYHQGLIPRTLISSLPKESKIEEFKLPKLIWNFLDSIRPGNSAQVVKLFHKIIETEAPEFIFVMIVWKLKKVYLGKPSAWVVEMINDLAEIDMEVKTGRADLVSSLDLLFITKLE
jgi:DNA polymerase III delta subunit